jgi:hypothetical protein
MPKLPSASELPNDELLQSLERLLADKVLTRFGPMYQIERMGGRICAGRPGCAGSALRGSDGAGQCTATVAHNYRREHALNMWFVLATETQDGIAEAVAAY